jgi:hypothetical protein
VSFRKFKRQLAPTLDFIYPKDLLNRFYQKTAFLWQEIGDYIVRNLKEMHVALAL